MTVTAESAEQLMNEYIARYDELLKYEGTDQELADCELDIEYWAGISYTLQFHNDNEEV